MRTTNTFLKLLIFVISITCTQGCKDLDDSIKIPNSEDLIQKDTEIFNLIDRVTKNEGDPLHDIVCIDFVYPIHLEIYDSALQPIGSVTIIGDDNFSAFLGILPADQSISISYPISTTLSDGTEFTVNNNTELKLAIDSCSREDIIAYCNGLFCNSSSTVVTPCIWKVQFDPEGNNQYLSGYFEANADGTITFFYNNQEYVGSWIFLFINDEFHLNINLEGTTQVALDWNIDRKVIISGDEIKIINPPKDTHLKKVCQEIVTYSIGETGPAGGIVFYDKGSYTNGWRYMEASLEDLSVVEWGCLGSDITNTSNFAIGKGMLNSSTILNYHDTLINYYNNPSICNTLSNGTVAAKEAIEYSINGYKDWFLPSHDELVLQYQNLHLESLGNFTNGLYWSSTQIDANNAAAIDFSTGADINNTKNNLTIPIKTRAIRYF